MNHEQIQNELMSLYDGEASAPQTKFLRDHLASCLDCQAAWQLWERSSAALFRPPEMAASEIFVQKVVARLPEISPERSGVWPWMEWLTPAFGLALAAFFFVSSVSQQKSQLAAESLFIAGLPVATDSAIVEALPLEGLLGLPADNG